MKKSSWAEVCCALLVLLFVYAGLSKVIPLWHFDQFRHDMNNQPFPKWFTGFLSYALPITELGIAVCLIPNRSRRVGLWLSAVFMSLFTLYAALILLHMFPYVPCGCGGIISHLSWSQHLIFNSIFTGIATTGIILLKSSHQHLCPATA